MLSLMKTIADNSNIWILLIPTLGLIFCRVLFRLVIRNRKSSWKFVLLALEVLLFVFVLIVTTCEIIYVRILPNDNNLVSFLQNNWKNEGTSDWLSMIGLVVTIITALISTVIACITYRMSKLQQQQNDFNFYAQFNIDLSDDKVDITSIRYNDNSEEYIHYCEKLKSKYRINKKIFPSKFRVNLSDIYIFRFKLKQKENAQVAYRLKKFAIFDSYVEWKKIDKLLNTNENNIYCDIVSDFYRETEYIMEVIVRNTNDSFEATDQHLVTLLEPAAFPFQNKSKYSIYMEFAMDSRYISNLIGNKLIRLGIELRKNNDYFIVQNSRLF